jgi:hypothetical protein
MDTPLVVLLVVVGIGLVLTIVFGIGMFARNEDTAKRNGFITAICLAVTGAAAIAFMALTTFLR